MDASASSVQPASFALTHQLTALQVYLWDGEAWSQPRSSPAIPAAFDVAAAKPAATNPAATSNKNRTIRFATMNILADCFPLMVELAICSPRRFKHLVPEIERINADVLGLNEVTANSLTAILASPFVRANYVSTHVPETIDKPHCCVILSRIPVVAANHINLQTPGADHTPTNRERFPAVVLDRAQPDGERVAVCALHTLAYQSEDNKKTRSAQIAATFAALREFGALLEVPESNVAVMGDLNLHYVSEDAVVLENNVVDAWAETHFGPGQDRNPGYTFDAVRNPMIPRYIPGERRQMRLDRILFASGFSLSPAGDCHMWGTEQLPIRTAEERRSVRAKVGLVRTTHDVTLSDHYGLFIDMRQRADGSRLYRDDAVTEHLQHNAAQPLEANHFSKTRFAGALALHVPFLLGRAVGVM